MIRRLKNIARKLGRPEDDAADLVQDAHERVFRYMRTTAVGNKEALLARTVQNLAINAGRRDLIIPYERKTLEELDQGDCLVDPAPGPEQILLAEQRLKKIEAMLNAANKKTCAIFMGFRAGYSYKELASEHGLSRSAIRKHLAHAAMLLIRYREEEQK